MPRWFEGLSKGDKIGLVMPARACSEQELLAVEKWIKEHGFIPVMPDHSMAVDPAQKFYAHSDEVRYSWLASIVTDPSIKAVWALKGGYGTARLLPLLDRLPINRTSEPKLFIGYSDLTVMLEYVSKRWDWITLHAAVAAQLVTDADLESEVQTDFLRAIKKETTEFSIPVSPKNRAAEESKSSLQGISKGGCLSLVASLMGTPYAVETKGSILLLEDVDEPGYGIDRLFTQLRLGGVFEKVTAVVLGWFNGFKPLSTSELEERNLALTQFALEMEKLQIPVFETPHIGHSPRMRAFPIGAQTKLDPKNKILTATKE